MAQGDALTKSGGYGDGETEERRVPVPVFVANGADGFAGHFLTSSLFCPIRLRVLKISELRTPIGWLRVTH